MFWPFLVTTTHFEAFLIVLLFQEVLDMLKELVYFSITKYFYISSFTKLLTEILFSFSGCF